MRADPTEMKADSPYLRLTHFPDRVRLNFLSESKYQHALLRSIQDLVEQALFYYAERWMPELLRKKNWTCPEDVELSLWWEHIRHHPIPTNSTFFPENTNVEKPFLRLSHVRHHAVHRVRTPVDVLKRMVGDALLLVGGLGDGLRENKLQHMKRALDSNDMGALGRAIDDPLDELPMINDGKIPAQLSRHATEISSNSMTTMASLSRPPPKTRRPPARAPSAPPPTPTQALLAQDSGPPPPRRHSARENMPILRSRSQSPVPMPAKSYRVRDDPARIPSMGTWNDRRFTGNFVDLTADSDDEANATSSKASYDRRQAPLNFVDLTLDD